MISYRQSDLFKKIKEIYEKPHIFKTLEDLKKFIKDVDNTWKFTFNINKNPQYGIEDLPSNINSIQFSKNCLEIFFFGKEFTYLKISNKSISKYTYSLNKVDKIFNIEIL